MAETSAEPTPVDIQLNNHVQADCTLSKSPLPEEDHGEITANSRQARKAGIIYYLYRSLSSVPNTSNAP